MINVYGYATGCPACELLKELLAKHNIPYNFIEVPKLTHPFKSVPQVFNPNGSYVGNYNTLQKELT